MADEGGAYSNERPVDLPINTTRPIYFPPKKVSAKKKRVVVVKRSYLFGLFSITTTKEE